MCRLDSSVNYILLATSLRFSSRIRRHWCRHYYTINSWQNRLYKTQCVKVHVMLDDIWTSDHRRTGRGGGGSGGSGGSYRLSTLIRAESRLFGQNTIHDWVTRIQGLLSLLLQSRGKKFWYCSMEITENFCYYPPPQPNGCKQFAFAIRAKLHLTPKWMLARTPMPQIVIYYVCELLSLESSNLIELNKSVLCKNMLTRF